MENEIKGLHLLKDVSKSDVDLMLQVARALQESFFIEFKFIEYADDKVIIRILQERAAPDYPGIHPFSKKDLVNIVHREFDKFFPGKKVEAFPMPFVPNPIAAVDEKWISDRMLKTGTRLKDIASDTGLNKSYLSTLINGVDPLSNMAKAMFYYYFQSKDDQAHKSIRPKEKKDET